MTHAAPPTPLPLSPARGAREFLIRHKSDIAAFVLVLIAAFATRFAQIEAVEFYHDEAMVSMMAQELAHGQTFPLVGILSSVGIPNPPAAIYVMAAPFAVTNDPVAATAYVALLNVIGVGILWAIARRSFGFTVALFAALIFAVNPWAVMYSRKIWAQDYVNPFLLLALASTLWGYVDGKRWGQILALPVMLFAMQIHFAAWALVPLFAWIGWSGRRNIHKWAVALSVVLSIVVMLPYMVGLIQTLQADPTRINDTLGREGITDKTPFDALRYAAQLAVGVNIESWVTPGIEPSTLPVSSLLPTAATVFGAGFILAGCYAVLWSRPAGWRMLFGLWILLPIAAFQVGLSDIWPHYFVPQLPAFALLGGIGIWSLCAPLSRMSPRLSRLLSLGAAALFLVWLLGPLIFATGVFQYATTHTVPISIGTSGYTTPMSILGHVRDAIPADIDDVLVLTDGDRVWFDVEAARWPVMLRDQARCVRTLPGDGFSVQPASDTYAVIHTPTSSARIRRLYTSEDSTTIPARLGEGEYVVTIHTGSSPTGQPSTWFSNGVGLLDWEISDRRVTLQFQLQDATDRTFYGGLNHDYQYFIHLLDADGNRIGQRDASFWPGRHWCANDQLSMWADIDGAADAATLRFGFYTLLDADAGTTQAVDILDVAGNAAGNWIDIPLQ